MFGVHWERLLSKFRWEGDEEFPYYIASEGRRIEEQEESILQFSQGVAPGRDGG